MRPTRRARTGFRKASIGSLLATLLLAAPSAGADPPPLAPIKVSAIVEATGGANPGTRRLGIDIHIRRVTPPADANRLAELITSSGQAGLQAAISSRQDGVLRLGAIEHPLNAASAVETSEGRRYVIVSVRPLRIEEKTFSSPSLDYPFGVLIFELDGFGRGSGEYYPAAAIRVTEGAVAIDGYQARPYRLLDVKEKR
jgi:hypothetical protein